MHASVYVIGIFLVAITRRHFGQISVDMCGAANPTSVGCATNIFLQACGLVVRTHYSVVAGEVVVWARPPVPQSISGRPSLARGRRP